MLHIFKENRKILNEIHTLELGAFHTYNIFIKPNHILGCMYITVVYHSTGGADESSVPFCYILVDISTVRLLKQLSTRILWNECKTHLSKFFWKKRVVWSNGYFCSTVGEISEKNLIEYINNQG